MTVRGICMSAKHVAGTRRAMVCFNGPGFKMLPANTPFASAQASSAAKSFRSSDPAISSSRSELDPAARAALITAPIDVPMM